MPYLKCIMSSLWWFIYQELYMNIYSCHSIKIKCILCKLPGVSIPAQVLVFILQINNSKFEFVQ